MGFKDIAKGKAILTINGQEIKTRIFTMKVNPSPEKWPDELIFKLTFANGEELEYIGKLKDWE